MDEDNIFYPGLLGIPWKFNQQELTRFYVLFSPGLYRYAMHMLNDQDLAEECVAETYSRFLQVLDNGCGPVRNLQGYLSRVAHNWIVDHYKRAPAQPMELLDEHRDDITATEVDTEDQLQQEHLRSALRKLTLQQRQVIILKYLEGWENEEIARVLKRSVGSVKSLQYRALAALKRILESE